MIFDKLANLDKQLPPAPIDAPPPYVFYSTTPDGDPLPSSSKPTPVPSPTPSTPAAPVRAQAPIPIPPSPPFITPPANFVSIVETHNAVKGSWTLDTGLPNPLPSFLSSPSSSSNPFSSFLARVSGENQPMEGEGAGELVPRLVPNLRLKSTHGKIDANVRVVRGERDSEPARIEVRSQHGSVKLALPFRGPQRLNILAVSPYGSIEIQLPRDFVGLIKHRTKYSKFSLSDDVTACSTTFSLEGGVGSTFVGDWRGVGFSGLCEGAGRSEEGLAEAMKQMAGASSDALVDIPGWPVDLLVMDSTYSKLKVSFAKPSR